MQKPPSEIDDAIARLARVEAVLRSPGAVLDHADAAVLAAALKCERLGVASFTEAFGLVDKWRDRACRHALAELLVQIPTKSMKPWRRAGEVYERLERYRIGPLGLAADRRRDVPQNPILFAVIEASRGRLSWRRIYKIFRDPNPI